MRRYTITVDRDAIDKGNLAAPIRVEDGYGGVPTLCASAALEGARIVSGPPRADGARVWIEADRVTIGG